MEDKEVGDIWRYWFNRDCEAPVIDIIRKLVEERVRRLKGTLRGREPGTPTDLELALAQFGIDPDDFK